MVELASWQARFDTLGYAVAAMTYDPLEQLARFHADNELPYPLLQDVDTRHVEAYGIRNQAFAPGDRGYGVPHPGVIVVDSSGTVIGTFAYPGFRDRPSFAAMFDALSATP